MKARLSVYANVFDERPIEVFEFSGTKAEVEKQITAWAADRDGVVFDLEITEGAALSAQYGLTT